MSFAIPPSGAIRCSRGCSRTRASSTAPGWVSIASTTNCSGSARPPPPPRRAGGGDVGGGGRGRGTSSRLARHHSDLLRGRDATDLEMPLDDEAVSLRVQAVLAERGRLRSEEHTPAL